MTKLIETSPGLDPVTFEVLKNSFITTVDQMAEQMLRTCYSFVIYNRDFSNALHDADGNPVAQGDIWIIEIKSSIEDFRVDRKWPDYRLHSDRFFFATHPGVPSEIFPHECGFILSDGYGAEILRDAPEHRMAAATRKALMLRIARAGASRLLAAELAGVSVPALEGESE